MEQEKKFMSSEFIEKRKISREEDRIQIENGEKTPEEINKKNAFFSGKNIKIDWDNIESLV